MNSKYKFNNSIPYIILYLHMSNDSIQKPHLLPNETRTHAGNYRTHLHYTVAASKLNKTNWTTELNWTELQLETFREGMGNGNLANKLSSERNH